MKLASLISEPLLASAEGAEVLYGLRHYCNVEIEDDGPSSQT